MGARDLKLDGGLNIVRVSDIPDEEGTIAVIIENHPSGGSMMLATLDRAQQHLLMLYLQERLK